MKNCLSRCVLEPTFKSSLRVPFSALIKIDYEPTDFVLRNRDTSPVILITLDYDEDKDQAALDALKEAGLPDWLEQFACFSKSRSGRTKLHVLFENFPFDHVKMAAALAKELRLPESFDRGGIDSTFALKRLFFAASGKDAMPDWVAKQFFPSDVFAVKEYHVIDFEDASIDLYDFIKKFSPLMRPGSWNRLEYIASIKAVKLGKSFEELLEIFKLLPGWSDDTRRYGRLRLTFNWALAKFGA